MQPQQPCKLALDAPLKKVLVRALAPFGDLNDADSEVIRIVRDCDIYC